MLQDLPPPSTATSERYCSSIGLVWMFPYGCPSASQMLLNPLATALRIWILFSLGEQTAASLRLVYPSLLLFTFCLPSGSLTCYFSTLALERKMKSFFAYLCQVIIPGFKTGSIYRLSFLFPWLSPSLLCCSLI